MEWTAFVCVEHYTYVPQSSSWKGLMNQICIIMYDHTITDIYVDHNGTLVWWWSIYSDVPEEQLIMEAE